MFTVSFQSFLTREVAFRYVSLLDPLTRSRSMCEFFSVSFRSFLTREVALGMSRISLHRSTVTGFVHEIQTSQSHFKHIYFLLDAFMADV